MRALALFSSLLFGAVLTPDDPPDRGKVFCGPQTENVRLE